MADIFVSYAREDRELAGSLVGILESQGWSVWWDREIGPGSSFSKVIEREIALARCVIVLWTARSVASDWVVAEASEGLSSHKLIPALLEDIEVPLVFRMTHSSNLVGWPRADRNDELAHLLDAVVRLIERPVVTELPAAPTPWPFWKPSAIAICLLAIAGLAYLGGSRFFSPSLTAASHSVDQQAPNDGVSTVLVEPIQNAVGDFAADITSHLTRAPQIRVVSARSAQDADFAVRGLQQGDRLVISLFDLNRQQTRLNFELELGDMGMYGAVQETVLRITQALNASYNRKTNSISNEDYLEYLSIQSEMRRYEDTQMREQLNERLENLIAKAPRFSEALAALCKLKQSEYADTGEAQPFTAAERYCLRALRLDKDNPVVLSALGMLYLLAGQLPEAEQSFQAALQASPTLTDAKHGLAQLRLKQGDLNAAVTEMREAQRIEPENWNLYHSLASIYFLQGSFEQAREQYEVALELAPDEMILYNDLGACYFMLEDFAGAIRNWEISLQGSEHYAALSNLGSAYYYEGNFEQALATYKRAIELNDSDYRLWLNAGEAAYHLSGEPAEPYYAKAVELGSVRLGVNPDAAEVLSALALANSSLGNEADGRRQAEQALVNGSSDIYILYDVAVAYSRLGDVEQRDKLLKQMVANGYSETLIARDANFKRG